LLSNVNSASRFPQLAIQVRGTLSSTIAANNKRNTIADFKNRDQPMIGKSRRHALLWSRRLDVKALRVSR
jgi:hypothetical protein